MASDDLVFVESGPSMQVIPSSSVGSPGATNNSNTKEFQHTYPPSPVMVPYRDCKPCELVFGSKTEYTPYSPIAGSSGNLERCCHGNCQRHDKAATARETIRSPPVFELPPPPTYVGPPSSYVPPPGVRTKNTKTSFHPPSPPPLSYNPPISCLPPPPPRVSISIPPPPPPFPLPPMVAPTAPPLPLPVQCPPPPPTPPFHSPSSRILRDFPESYDSISTPADLLPVRYSGESLLDTSRVIRIAPFKRNLLLTFHRAHIADFEELKWLLQHGSTDTWYTTPPRAWLRAQDTADAAGAADLPSRVEHARPVSLETPRVWASAALVTPTDDDVYDCATGHTLANTGAAPFSGACPTCTDEKTEALEATPLTYYVVLATCQASEPFVHGAHFNGTQIYKLVKCGSRDAAAAEAFYAAGVNGWSVVFSCAVR
ncbi:hypothetical protein BU23DRAFT_594464, partial [Bimuria novae-zelandiae CBS 107.79]